MSETDNKEALSFLREFISLLKKQDFILPELQLDILSYVSKLLTDHGFLKHRSFIRELHKERIKQILEEEGVLNERR